MNNDIAWEVSNVYRTNISRRRIERKNKRQKQSLEQQANAICKESLSERYIHNAFGKFDGGYAYYDSDEDGILGFCLWKISDKKTLHILLICSRNPLYSLGRTIINDIEYYCFENKIPLISVMPATESLYRYYEKLGFEKDGDQMKKHLVLQEIHKRKGNRTRRVPMTKEGSPIIASMMPIDMNVWKNNLL